MPVGAVEEGLWVSFRHPIELSQLSDTFRVILNAPSAARAPQGSSDVPLAWNENLVLQTSSPQTAADTQQLSETEPQSGLGRTL